MSQFAAIAQGASVFIMVGGRSHVRAVGVVQKVTPARFDAQFPSVPEAGIDKPFTMTFRKSDGRAVGSRYRHVAQLAPA